MASKALFYFLSLIMVFVFVSSNVREAKDVRKTLVWISVLGSLMGFFAIVERFTSYNLFRSLHHGLPFLQIEEGTPFFIRPRGGSMRVYGSGDHPLAFGATMTIIAPITLSFFLYHKAALQKFFYGISTALIVTGALLTVSRTAFIGLLLIFVIFFINKPRLRIQFLFWGGLFLLYLNLQFPGLIEQFFTLLSPSFIKSTEIGNSAGRFEDYPHIFLEFIKHPAFGRGYGTFDHTRFFFVDNQYLKFLVELGIVGLLAYLWFIFNLVWSFQVYLRRLDQERQAMLIAISASAIFFTVATALFDSFSFQQFVYLFMILAALGLSLIATAEKERSSDEEPLA